jgi:hypothetical protein
MIGASDSVMNSRWLVIEHSDRQRDMITNQMGPQAAGCEYNRLLYTHNVMNMYGTMRYNNERIMYVA